MDAKEVATLSSAMRLMSPSELAHPLSANNAPKASMAVMVLITGTSRT